MVEEFCAVNAAVGNAAAGVDVDATTWLWIENDGPPAALNSAELAGAEGIDRL